MKDGISQKNRIRSGNHLRQELLRLQQINMLSLRTTRVIPHRLNNQMNFSMSTISMNMVRCTSWDPLVRSVYGRILMLSDKYMHLHLQLEWVVWRTSLVVAL